MVEISYVKRDTAKFLQKMSRVGYEDQGRAIGGRGSKLACGLSDLRRVCCRGAELLTRETNQSGCRTARVLSNSAVLRDLRGDDRRENMRETPISMVEA